MVLNGSDRNEQTSRDLLIGVALRKELENLLLARGEAAGVCLCCRSSTSRDSSDAKIAHGAAHQARCRFGTKINKSGQRLTEVGLLLRIQQCQCGLKALAQPIPEFDSPCTIP